MGLEFVSIFEPRKHELKEVIIYNSQDLILPMILFLENNIGNLINNHICYVSIFEIANSENLICNFEKY